MLRTAVLVIGGVLAVAGIYMLLQGLAGAGIYALGTGFLFLVGTLFERWRYRKDKLPEDASWQATGERFADPITGKNVEVLYDPVSGERRYDER